MSKQEFVKPKLSLLSLEDVQGKNKLEVLEKFGLKAELTDLALLTGGTNRGKIFQPKIGNPTLINECSYILQSINHSNDCNFHITKDGEITTFPFPASCSSIGIVRLCLELPTYMFDEIVLSKRVLENGVSEVDCGLLPLFSLNEEEQELIENFYFNGKLKIMAREQYYFYVKNRDGVMVLNEYEVYSYDNKKYIRMSGEYLHSYELGYAAWIKLTNGKAYCDNSKYIWLELCPVTWLIDEKSKKLISKKGLFTTDYECLLANDYLNNILFEDMFGDMFKKIHYEFVRGEKAIEVVPQNVDKYDIFRIICKKIITLLQIPFGRKIVKSLPPSSSPKQLLESSTDLALVQEETKDIALVEEKIEINNEEINRLCDYIKEKSLLLVPNKRKEVLERLNELLESHKREMQDLDSEMYVKYNLSLTTPEGSKLALWNGLNSLKLDVDTFLLDNDNILNYGEEYLIYLRNSINNYQIQEQEKKLSLDKSKMDKFVKLLIKIDDEYNKITPYFRDEILGLIILIIHLFVKNDPFYMHIYVGNIGSERNIIKSREILDKLIVWFENWYKDNKDKLDDERQRKYLEIKMTMSMENKFAYIVELARIIDPTLITIKEDKKVR